MHRSLHSLADILLLGRESGQGGPNLREGGGPIRLESAFRQLLVQKRHQHFQQPTTRVSWVPLASARSAP